MRGKYQIAIAFFAVFMASSPLSADTPIGNTIQTSTIVSANGRTLQRSSPVYLNDVLRSNATGLGQFVFDDGTKLAMGPSATLTVDKTIYKGKSIQRASIQATKGAFRYISGATSGHKLVTPYGTIGIRGTAFDFTIRNGRVYILLFRGAVDFCGRGGCKTLNRTCDFLVGGGGKVSDPKSLSAGLESGLKLNEAFPLLVGQDRLTSTFRQAGRSCVGRSVERQDTRSTRAAQNASVKSDGPSAGPGPGPDPGPGNDDGEHDHDDDGQGQDHNGGGNGGNGDGD